MSSKCNRTIMTLSTFPAYEQISSLRYRRGFTLGGGLSAPNLSLAPPQCFGYSSSMQYQNLLYGVHRSSKYAKMRFRTSPIRRYSSLHSGAFGARHSAPLTPRFGGGETLPRKYFPLEPPPPRCMSDKEVVSVL